MASFKYFSWSHFIKEGKNFYRLCQIFFLKIVFTQSGTTSNLITRLNDETPPQECLKTTRERSACLFSAWISKRISSVQGRWLSSKVVTCSTTDNYMQIKHVHGYALNDNYRCGLFMLVTYLELCKEIILRSWTFKNFPCFRVDSSWLFSEL